MQLIFRSIFRNRCNGEVVCSPEVLEVRTLYGFFFSHIAALNPQSWGTANAHTAGSISDIWTTNRRKKFKNMCRIIALFGDKVLDNLQCRSNTM